MSTTVDIIIKGVAIGYRKGNDWHVLFPIDDEGCHSIYFSHRKNDEKNSKPAALAKAAKPIIITTSGASSTTGETGNFNQFVLNLTSPLTHPKIKMKGNLGRQSRFDDHRQRPFFHRQLFTGFSR